MELLVNDQQITVDKQIKVKGLLQQINSPEKGVAVAVNDVIVPRTEWHNYQFNENDNVLVIKAHSGG